MNANAHAVKVDYRDKGDDDGDDRGIQHMRGLQAEHRLHHVLDQVEDAIADGEDRQALDRGLKFHLKVMN